MQASLRRLSSGLVPLSVELKVLGSVDLAASDYCERLCFDCVYFP